MEKVFHFNHLRSKKPATGEESPQVRLKRGHLWMPAKVAEEAFGQDRQVYAVYYPAKQSLLLAPHSDKDFGQLHKCSLLMLKDRSLAGDKSISLQEIIIDHELSDQDRDLDYNGGPGLPLQVKLD